MFPANAKRIVLGTIVDDHIINARCIGPQILNCRYDIVPLVICRNNGNDTPIPDSLVHFPIALYSATYKIPKRLLYRPFRFMTRKSSYVYNRLAAIAQNAPTIARRTMLDIASATNVDNSTTRKPCICIFSALYEPHVGGVESYTKGIAEALVTAGCRVIVATSNTDNATALEAVNGIDILRLPCNPLLNSRFPIPKNNQESKRLWSWLNEQPIDYIVVNTRFYPHSILGLRFAKRHGIQPVLIEHGSCSPYAGEYAFRPSLARRRARNDRHRKTILSLLLCGFREG